MTAHLSRSSGGFAASIPGMRRALESHRDVRVRIVGLADSEHPDDWALWGPRVGAVAQTGPRAVGFGRDLGRAIAAGNPDVVDAQGIWMYPSAASLMWHRKSGKPYVVTPRGMLDPWALSVARPKKALAYMAFERQHLARAACLRATSELEAENFRAFGLTNPIAVIPNGLDVPLLGKRPDSERRRLLLLSRLHPKKGIDVLLAAWARLEARYADWDLVIAGPDEKGHREQMQALARSLNVGRVTWLDSVTGDAKDGLYRASDVFVLPTRAENFGLVIAEALANEVPVITTRHAPWSGLQSQACGWWIELGEDELVAAMNEAMQLPRAELHARGARGRAWVAMEYGWDAIGDKLVAMYEWVSGRGTRPAFVIT